MSIALPTAHGTMQTRSPLFLLYVCSYHLMLRAQIQGILVRVCPSRTSAVAQIRNIGGEGLHPNLNLAHRPSYFCTSCALNSNSSQIASNLLDRIKVLLLDAAVSNRRTSIAPQSILVDIKASVDGRNSSNRCLGRASPAESQEGNRRRHENSQRRRSPGKSFVWRSKYP